MYTPSDIEKTIKKAVKRTVWEVDRIVWIEKTKCRVYLCIRTKDGKKGMLMNFSLANRHNLFEYHDADDVLGNLTVLATGLDQMEQVLVRLLP